MMTPINPEARFTTPAYIQQIRQDFPILHQAIYDCPLAYLDNAATTQKPQCMIDCLQEYYTTMNANIHRGVHRLSAIADNAFEATREKIRAHINANSAAEIIFVKGTTEAINLVANTYGLQHLTAGDEIIISEMEHHANIVPWQLLCQRTQAILTVIPMTDAGEISLAELEQLLSPRTKLLAILHISNVLGTINPIHDIIKMAHRHHVPVLVDGAQAGCHLPVDVQALDCDFYTLSAHKMYGPTGIGVLYGKAAILKDMPPYQGGGDMIQAVTFKESIFAPIPRRFEAGTPPIASVIAWGTALDYLATLDTQAILAHEQALLQYATEKSQQLPDFVIYGQSKHKASILSFNLGNIHAHDLGTICDQYGVAIRTGHHCAMPIMQHFNIAAAARASFAFYNTFEEIDQLFLALTKAWEIFHP